MMSAAYKQQLRVRLGMIVKYGWRVACVRTFGLLAKDSFYCIQCRRSRRYSHSWRSLIGWRYQDAYRLAWLRRMDGAKLLTDDQLRNDDYPVCGNCTNSTDLRNRPSLLRMAII